MYSSAYLDTVYTDNNGNYKYLVIALCDQYFRRPSLKLYTLQQAKELQENYACDFKIDNGNLLGNCTRIFNWTGSEITSFPFTIYEKVNSVRTVVGLLQELVLQNIPAQYVSRKIVDDIKETGEYVGTGVCNITRIRVSKSTMTLAYSLYVNSAWTSDVIVDCETEVRMNTFYIAADSALPEYEKYMKSVRDCTINGVQYTLYMIDDIPLFDYESYQPIPIPPILHRLSYQLVVMQSIYNMLDSFNKAQYTESTKLENIGQRSYPAKKMTAPVIKVESSLKILSGKEDYALALKYAYKYCEQLNWKKLPLSELYQMICNSEMDFVFGGSVAYLVNALLQSEDEHKIDFNVLQVASESMHGVVREKFVYEMSQYSYRLSLVKLPHQTVLNRVLVCKGGGVPGETFVGGENFNAGE